jgi:hypothetical protein
MQSNVLQSALDNGILKRLLSRAEVQLRNGQCTDNQFRRHAYLELPV